MLCSRAFTVTTTKLTLNRMWPIRIVPNPRCTPRLRNSASSDEPMTTSGVAIGRKIRKFVGVRPVKRWRTRANAISVPSAVAAIVASAAI